MSAHCPQCKRLLASWGDRHCVCGWKDAPIPTPADEALRLAQYDPFNCPKCGAHDYGLIAPQIGGHCWHCLINENLALLAEKERLQGELASARVCSCGAPANYCRDCASGDVRAAESKAERLRAELADANEGQDWNARMLKAAEAESERLRSQLAIANEGARRGMVEAERLRRELEQVRKALEGARAFVKGMVNMKLGDRLVGRKKLIVQLDAALISPTSNSPTTGDFLSARCEFCGEERADACLIEENALSCTRGHGSG